jgi:aminopeptidase
VVLPAPQGEPDLTCRPSMTTNLPHGALVNVGVSFVETDPDSAYPGALSDRRHALLLALAELVVSDVGVNVQSGQVVGITAQPGMEDVWRAVAEAAYRRGARFVDVWIFDPYVKHTRLAHAPADSLSYRPPWWGERYHALGELGGAQISLAGQVAPTLMDDIPGERLGRDVLPRIPELFEIISAQSVNWTVIPAPCGGWASLVHADLDPAAALDRLWEEIALVMRLEQPDPAAAWRERFAQLQATGAHLNALCLDALRFVGPGTDLTVGLLPGSLWRSGYDERSDGLTFGGNLPTEEVYTAPDPRRVHGHVTSTKPLVLSGQTVRGLRVRFDHGAAVDVTADHGAELVATTIQSDEGAARLGEVALVDGESRIGQLGTVFYDTLLDENSASHIALGAAYPDTVSDDPSRAQINESSIHIDFMIGSADVAVTGISRDGTAVPLLRGGAWQFSA